MTDDQRDPTPGYTTQIWQFILGYLIFGIFSGTVFMPGSVAAVTSSVGMIAMALTMIIVTGGAAIWAMRHRKIALGSGLLVGYAIVAVGSGGQCTFFAPGANYGFFGGAAIYIVGFVIAILIGWIASIYRAIRSRWNRGSRGSDIYLYGVVLAILGFVLAIIIRWIALIVIR
jgi:hypothetical protein